MNRSQRAPGALVILVLAACASTSTADAGRATAAPTSSAPWVSFTSERYGYSIDHPADWRVLEQAGEVRLDGMRPESPGTDNLVSEAMARVGGRDGMLVISAHPLETGEDLVDFTVRASRATTCGTEFPARDADVGGEPALRHSFVCAGYDWLQYTAIHGDRGYVIWMLTTVGASPGDRPINDEFLASFRFTD